VLSRTSLLTKTFIYTIIISACVWFITDEIQTTSLTEIFRQRLSNNFSLQAEKQRILFDRYVKGHHQTLKIFSKTHNIINYVSNNSWNKNQSGPYKIYDSSPPWLPDLSTIRNFIHPRYFFLTDTTGKVIEYYQLRDQAPPESLLQPDAMLLSLSHNQGFLTQIEQQPYLIATAEIHNRDNIPVAKLILASALDEEFLIASQGAELEGSNIIALLSEGENKVLISSNSQLIPQGTEVNSLQDNYLVTGQGFFDYGATDIIIELISFVSTSEADQLTKAIISEERPLRMIVAVSFIAAFLIVMYLMTRRLRVFTNQVLKFSNSLNMNNQLISKQGDELKVLESVFYRISNAVERETAALEHQALHDPLTDLPNRKLLNNRLQQEILRASRNNIPLVLIMSDLNHFKEINDTLGHHIGDLVLQQAAQRLFKIFRKTDSVARLGGDEFGVLLPETNLNQATKLTRKVIQQFEKPFIVEGHTLSVGISLGLAESPLHGNDVNILVQRADIAMYLAKQENIGFEIYDPDKDTHSIGRLALMTDFRFAIEHEMLEIYYQPKLSLKDNTVTGVEALLRWYHAERGMIMPADFIPLAEQTGLIKPLTRYVIESAIKQSVEWRDYHPDLSVAVNISVHSLHDVSFIDFIKNVIAKHQFPAASLTLEITESDIMQDPIRALETLEKLSAMDVVLAIDDFGTGYSSLSYLKQLPVAELKIDRSFVSEMTKDENDAIIVRATIDMAHNLGLSVVAEGVENKQTYDSLLMMKCDCAQGYFIGTPVPAYEFNSRYIDQSEENYF